MIELKHISFTVSEAEHTDILNNVSVTIPDSGVFLLTGPNGGGKSTLAKIIMGILKPTDGSIFFNGKDITQTDITERAKMGIGYAFQTPPRFKGLTVRKMLNIAHGAPMTDEECCRQLSKVGLCSKEYLSRPLDASLSGGELKRIEVASLLARDLSLAMYDEPEAGIDLWSFNMLVGAFKNAERNKSILIISHQERIMELADTIAIVAGGKIAASGPRSEMMPQLSGFFTNLCAVRKGISDGC